MDRALKVVAFNGSARKGGNTAQLLEHALVELRAEGVETELIELAGLDIRPCLACRNCSAKKNRLCSQTNDAANELIAKMDAADGMLFGSPTYFADITAQIKALLDRAFYVASANDGIFARKVGAGVVSVSRGGAIHAFDSLNHYFLIGQMIIPGSSYWNVGIGREPGEIQQDEEGLRTMRCLGKNMAWLLKKLHA